MSTENTHGVDPEIRRLREQVKALQEYNNEQVGRRRAAESKVIRLKERLEACTNCIAAAEILDRKNARIAELEAEVAYWTAQRIITEL